VCTSQAANYRPYSRNLVSHALKPRIGVAPALKVDGKFIANPLVETSRITVEYGRFVFGKPKTGDALKAGQDLMKRGAIELTLLDDKVERDARDRPRNRFHLLAPCAGRQHAVER
jgi:hypothetical protein